tara:strand:+ start:176 stop:295 length:120 start_codon:yes stop_codon:yes gene_type:complete
VHPSRVHEVIKMAHAAVAIKTLVNENFMLYEELFGFESF